MNPPATDAVALEVELSANIARQIRENPGAVSLRLADGARPGVLTIGQDVYVIEESGTNPIVCEVLERTRAGFQRVAGVHASLQVRPAPEGFSDPPPSPDSKRSPPLVPTRGTTTTLPDSPPRKRARVGGVVDMTDRNVAEQCREYAELDQDLTAYANMLAAEAWDRLRPELAECIRSKLKRYHELHAILQKRFSSLGE